MSNSESKNSKSQNKNEKTSTNNQWISTGIDLSDNRERRDGPGGENSNNK